MDGVHSGEGLVESRRAGRGTFRVAGDLIDAGWMRGRTGENPCSILMMARVLISGFSAAFAIFVMLAGGAIAQVRVNTVLALSDSPDVNVLNVTLSALGIEDQEESELSGTVNAILAIDPATDEVSEFTLSSGDLTASDMSFSLELGPISVADVDLSGIRATIATSLQGPVIPGSGQFDASLHQVTLYEGAIAGSAITGEIDENFTESPVTGSGAGTGTVTLSRAAVEGNIVTYDVLVVLPLEFSSPIQDGVDVIVNSTVQMEGAIEVPLDPYLGWAELNGIPDAPFEEDHDGDGVPNGLLWALGYNANDRPSLFTPDLFIPGQVDLIVTPGPVGIRAPVFVEGNFDEEGWTLLDPFLLLGFENPVPVGEDWPIVIFLSGDRNFVRLRVEKP